MRSTIRILAVAAGTLCSLAFLLVKTRLDSGEEHRRHVNLLLELQKVDSSLNEELLEVRYAQLLNYDPLVKNLRDLKAGAERLKALPGSFEEGSEGHSRMVEQVSELLRLLAQKEDLVERFKSENSTLRNSLSFFPVAASELAQVLDVSQRGLALEVQALLRDVLMYNLHSNEEILPPIQARIAMLSVRQRIHGQAAWTEEMRRVLNHGNTILEYKTRLDRITREALELPTRSLLRRIQSTYWEQSLRMVSLTNDYRLALYLFAIVLMATIAYSFLRLQNTTLALNEANLTLEKRVQERTEDLKQATNELTRQKDQLVLNSKELEQALRRETEATVALKESEMQLALAQEVSHTGNWVFKTATGGFSWSAELYRIYGLDPQPTPSKELLLRHVHPEDRPVVQQTVERALDERSAFETEHRIVRSDGQHRFVHARAQVLVDDSGRPSTMVGTVQDVTERKEMQTKLVHAERMASLGTLAGGVAHEINNPLSCVLSNLEFMSSGLRDVEDVAPPGWLAETRQVIGDSFKGAERVRRIVQDLRTFTRPSNKVGPVDMHQILDLAITMASSQIQHRAKLVRDYFDVPPVRGDAPRLGQVALNLLVNAAQAIPDGKATENEIRVVTRMDGAHRVVFEVRDTGCGIPPEIRRHLFEPFLTTKPVGKGTGLGLSVCHGIVTSLGGEITVESEVGKGSTFRVSIPVAGQAIDPARPTTTAAPGHLSQGGRPQEGPWRPAEVSSSAPSTSRVCSG